MSAETLRRAAALMRERAEAARAGRWLSKGGQVFADWQSEPRHVAVCSGSIDVGNASNAAHIASWHPDVALAVADLLDEIALRWEYVEERELALAVARAYLGEHA